MGTDRRDGPDPVGDLVIRLLLAAHPRRWRARYAEEFTALLEQAPLTAAVVLDVLGNAVRLHAAGRPLLLRLLAAVLVSVPIELLAVRAGLTDNVLWSPSTPPRALALAALALAWSPVGVGVWDRSARRARAGR